MQLTIRVGSKPKVELFHQLADNQPFKDAQGNFCIKSGHDSYIILFDENGDTYATTQEYVDPDTKIETPLPMIRDWRLLV